MITSTLKSVLDSPTSYFSRYYNSKYNQCRIVRLPVRNYSYRYCIAPLYYEDLCMAMCKTYFESFSFYKVDGYKSYFALEKYFKFSA